MADDDKLPDSKDLDERLARLNDRIKTERRTHKEDQDRKPDIDKAGIGQAFRLSSEFIAAIIVGGLIGYAIDFFFETSPFGLLIFLLLGFAAGILNVLRAVGKVAESPLRRHNDAEHDEK